MWKFAGLAPEIRWGEYEWDRVFEGGREEFGEEGEKVKEEVGIVAGVGVENSIDTPPTDEEVRTPTWSAASPELSPTDAEGVHTASGIESTIEKLPVEVTAKMMMLGPI